MMYATNKTGCRGVCFESKAQKYRAYINVCGEKIRLGYFSNLEDAVKARKDAEKFYFSPVEGTFRVFNIFNQPRVETFYMLLKSVFEYDWGSVAFSTHSMQYIKKHSSRMEPGNVMWLPYFETMQFDNKHLLIDWMNGDSFKKISKKYNIPEHIVNKSVKDCVELLKKEFK